MKYLAFLTMSLLLLCISCKDNETDELIKHNGLVFGTSYSIIYEGQTNYEKGIDSVYRAVNQSLSTYLPTSDISRINNGDTSVVVDAIFMEAFKKAKKIYKETDGYFDPTIGRLIDAYGFGSGKEQVALSSQRIDSLMTGVGFDKVRLENGRVYCDISHIEFNVNAFAKGFGIDLVGRYLESKDIRNYLIEIGGEIRARGTKKGAPWRVAIEKPNSDGSRSVQKIISLFDESMATSGNYRKFKINEAGQKIVHTVNAKTGEAVESNLLSVSVRMKGDCADVDAYATAFLAMGLKKTKTFLKEHPELRVFLIFRNSANELEEFMN